MTAPRRGPEARAYLAAVIAQREWKAYRLTGNMIKRRRLEAMVRCIRAGMSYSETAEIFDVTRGYVSNVVHNQQGKGVAPTGRAREG